MYEKEPHPPLVVVGGLLRYEQYVVFGDRDDLVLAPLLVAEEELPFALQDKVDPVADMLPYAAVTSP